MRKANIKYMWLFIDSLKKQNVNSKSKSNAKIKITIINGIETEMIKFEKQFVSTAMLVALPLASEANSSDVMSHGIEPF